jgi:hypothetical protein
MKLFGHDSEPTFTDLYREMSDMELRELLSDWHSLVPEARLALGAELLPEVWSSLNLRHPRTRMSRSFATSLRFDDIETFQRRWSHARL